MTRSPRFPLTIYYDASCPMCASEMHALKARDRTGRLDLVDCSAADFEPAFVEFDGLSRSSLMARIHARDRDGRWLVGVDVFEAAYRAAGLHRAARLWGSRLLRPFLRFLYPKIADHRRLLSRLGANALVGWLIPKPPES